MSLFQKLMKQVKHCFVTHEPDIAILRTNYYSPRWTHFKRRIDTTEIGKRTLAALPQEKIINYTRYETSKSFKDSI